LEKITEFSSLSSWKERKFTRVSSCRCKDIIVEDDKRSNDSVRFFSLIHHRICVGRARILLLLLLLLLPEEEEEEEEKERR